MKCSNCQKFKMDHGGIGLRCPVGERQGRPTYSSTLTFAGPVAPSRRRSARPEPYVRRVEPTTPVPVAPAPPPAVSTPVRPPGWRPARPGDELDFAPRDRDPLAMLERIRTLASYRPSDRASPQLEPHLEPIRFRASQARLAREIAELEALVPARLTPATE